MLAGMRFALLVGMLAVLAGCGDKGGKPPNGSEAYERDQKHCNVSSDCTSGVCRDGRCG
jgi:hypothetical protein